MHPFVLDPRFFGSVKVEDPLGAAFLVRRPFQEGRFLLSVVMSRQAVEKLHDFVTN